MSAKRRGLLFIDHHQARLIRVLPDSTDHDVIVVAGDHERPHERKHDGGHRHPVSTKFVDRVVDALRDYGDVVVAGPSSAKDELVTQLRERHPDAAAHVSSVTTLDHETDAQLAAEARLLFERLDHMRGIHIPQAPGRNH